MDKLPKQNRRCLAFAVACLVASAFSVAAQEDVIRVETELVNLNVVVMDRQGRRVSGLTREDFEVFEDQAQQEISHFNAEERPLRLVLVFDVSLSMEAILPIVKQEARALLRILRPDDEVSVISFASQVRRHSDWLKREEAGDIISSVVPEPHSYFPLPTGVDPNVGVDPNTYLYEAFQYIFDNFKAPHDRVAVLMFSDGRDTRAGRDIRNVKKRAQNVGEEVRRQAQESWALLYPIRYQTEREMPKVVRGPFPSFGIRLGSPAADPGRKLFAQIAEATGGELFDWTTRQDLLTAIGHALADLRGQYGIAYTPRRTNSKDDFRRIKVRVKRPSLVVRTREGYFDSSLQRPGGSSHTPPNHR